MKVGISSRLVARTVARLILVGGGVSANVIKIGPLTKAKSFHMSEK